MANKYLVKTEAEALNTLLSQMTPEDLKLYQEFGRGKSTGHHRVEPVFIDRIFYIYQATGKSPQGNQRPPKVVAIARVINVHFTLERGFEVTLLDEISNTKQVIGHRPQKIFGFPVFAQVPNSFTVRWNLVEYSGHRTGWEPAWVLYIKAANKSDFFSVGNYYCETPQKMKSLYPNLDWTPDAQL